MTDREKAIVMAYTGATMLTGDKLMIFYRYLEDIMGRSVYSHELGFIAEEIRQKSFDDFIKLCETTECEQTTLEDAISRRAVLDGINRYIEKAQSTGTKDDFISFEELVVKDLPSVNPQEPKTGRWEFVGDDCYRCTACGEVYTSDQFDAINNYCDNRFPKGCPNCGARIESEVNNGWNKH